MSEVGRSQNYTFAEWLESYQQSSTRSTYYNGARLFLQSSYQTNDEPEALASRYYEETKAGRRNYFKDLVSFVNTYKDRPPKSLHLYVAIVRQFLLYCCDIDMTTKEERVKPLQGSSRTLPIRVAVQ